MLYLCSENKGADQLRGYREAGLRLCFCICKKPVFSRCSSNLGNTIYYSIFMFGLRLYVTVNNFSVMSGRFPMENQY